MEDNRDAEDRWQDEYMATVHQFAQALKEAHQYNPWPDLPLLPQAIDYLMTELWDRCFSQTEIREAFELALRNLPQYAAGQEVRP